MNYKRFLDSLPSSLYHSPEDPSLISFKFLTQQPAALSFTEYAQKLVDETACGAEVLVYVVAWIRGLKEKRPDLDISQWTIHRLFLAALVVAIKYASDFYWSNAEYASIGGISLRELNKLELLFAHDLMQWQLYVDEETTLKDLYLQAVLG